MTASHGSRFPADCRRFLTRLDEWVGSEATDSHLVDCASCTERLAAARRTAAALAAVSRPEIPAEVSSPEFLNEIYARANDQLESSLADELRRVLSPVSAPADVSWIEEDLSPEIQDPLQQALRQTRSPGWMWKRIRSATAPAERPRIHVLRSAAGVAAAVLVAAGIFLVQKPGPNGGSGGNKRNFTVVETPTAMDTSFSLDGLIDSGR